MGTYVWNRTHRIVVHLLAQDEVELFQPGVLEPRLELDQHAILEEVVELNGSRQQALCLKVGDPTTKAPVSSSSSECMNEYCVLFLAQFSLEADNISVLDLALRKGHLGLHNLNHPGFNFLQFKVSSANARGK